MKLETVEVRGAGSLDSALFDAFLLEDSAEYAVRRRPMVIVCPGGAYASLSDREADRAAMQFCAMGYHAGVLRYSVAPSRYPAALLELGRAVLAVRNHAEAWSVDPDRIAVLGFSAGGHLVGSFCTQWDMPWVAQALGCASGQLRPNAMILCYPVITAGRWCHEGSFMNLLGADWRERKGALSLETLVRPSAPPAFLWHTAEDPAVPAQNSIAMAAALAEQSVPVELHLFERGGHGLAFADEMGKTASGGGVEKSCQCWVDLLHAWLERWRTSG